jgi:hypothetical protein
VIVGLPKNQRDYFAEHYVAAHLADAGWNLFFPRRDKGFDFIITKELAGHTVVRPVQVKGKYPEQDKTDKGTYGYMGEMTALHAEMVLAIPYFPTDVTATAPTCIAYMPRFQIRPQQGRGWRCEPAVFSGGIAKPRRDFLRYFDRPGLQFMEQADWNSPATPQIETSTQSTVASASLVKRRTPKRPRRVRKINGQVE